MKFKALAEKLKKIFSSKKAIIITVIACILVIAIFCFFKFRKPQQSNEPKMSVVRVTKGNISNIIEGSGVIEANEQYDISSLVSGDIIADYFSDGDMVEEDQVLYKIDSSSIEKNIEKSNNSLRQTQLSYNEAMDNLDNLTVKASCGGTITAMYVEEGDKISSNTKICDIINNETMELELSFLASEAGSIYAGQSARVEITGESGSFQGSVYSVSSGSTVNSFGTLVKTVKIHVKNPGGIKPSDTATAVIGDAACTAPGNFEYSESRTVYSEAQGTVYSISRGLGDKVNKNDAICLIDSSGVNNQFEKASLSLRDAQLSLENLYDDLDQYSITSPITGKIIQKNLKAGDKLSNQGSSNVMAVVADLSKFKLTINVDELDIKNLSVGQKATVTADALEGQIFEGSVNNISIIGTSQNGVTTYPVEIIIDNADDIGLIPGMNVDASIIIEEKKDVLLIPAQAVSRGNTVMVNNEPVKVELGIKSGDLVEVISGLSEGDEITYEIEADASNPFAAMMGMGGGMPRGGMPGGGMPGGNRP